MEKQTLLFIFGMVLTVAVVFGYQFGRDAYMNQFSDIPFVSAEWKADTESPLRYKMHRYLISQELEQGMTKDSIEALVGPLSCTNDGQICQIELGKTPNFLAQKHYVHFEFGLNDTLLQIPAFRQ